MNSGNAPATDSRFAAFDPRTSLRGQVWLLIGGIVLALSLFLSTAAGSVLQNQIQRDSGQFLASLALELSVQLDRTMFERWREVQAVALTGPFATTGITEPETVRPFIDSLQFRYPFYSWVGWVDASGRVLVGTDGLLEGINVGQQRWFQQAQNGTIVGDVYEAYRLATLLPNPSGASMRFVDVATPVHDANGELVGVIGAHLDWRWSLEITESLSRGIEQSGNADSVDVLVVNRDGVVLVGPPQFQARTMEELPRTEIVDTLDNDGTSSGYQIFEWPDEGEYLVGYSRDSGYREYPGLGWLVIVRQPTSVAFAPTSRLQTRILNIGVANAALFSLLSWWLAGRAIRPLMQIANAVRNIRDTHVDVKLLEIGRRDEVGVLAQALRELITRLQQQHRELEALNSTLEQQVMERTATAESRALALSQEIAIRRVAEEMLRDSEARFRVLAEASREGLLVADGDTIVNVNPALLQMFGYDRADQIVGESAMALFEAPHTAPVHETPSQPVHAPYETVARQADGSTFPVEVLEQPYPSRGRNLRVSSIRDLTERKLYEAATQLRLEHLAKLQRVDAELTDKLSVQHVLNLALDATMRLSMADAGYIAQYDDGALQYAHVLGVHANAERAPVSEHQARAIVGSGLLRFFSAGGPTPDALSVLPDTAAQMLLPLQAGEDVFGVLSLETQAPENFTEETFQFLRLVATRIGVAFDNAQLYERTERQLVQVRALSQALAHQASHDALTGLANRTLFERRFKEAVTSSEQSPRRFAVGYVDLDHFKQINDRFGHAAGDDLLREVATRLQGVGDDNILFARVGGDEFAFIVELEDDTEAKTVAHAIAEAMNAPFTVRAHTLKATSSVGVSLYPHHSREVDTLLRYADYALYQAKLAGRNTYAIYDPVAAGIHDVTQYAALEHDLLSALENGQMLLQYQPQLDLKSNAITGVEALVRWQHPVFGVLSPATFVPVAEDSGLIAALGDWVLHEASRQCRQWHDEGHPITVGVNVSTPQLERADVVERVVNALQTSGLPASALMLEITESLLMRDVDLRIRTLQQLRELGVQVAVDDFGTGFSSLAYLRDLPATALKIDRAFISELRENSRAEDPECTIIQAIITLAHALDLEVIAEGVEHAYQVEMLRSLKSDSLQGYLLGRPLNASEISALLAQPSVSKRF